MYKVINDNGNVYVLDNEDNYVSFKDPDVSEKIANDNSIITGEGCEDIIAWCNSSQEQKLPNIEMPYYLTEEAILSTSLQEDN